MPDIEPEDFQISSIKELKYDNLLERDVSSRDNLIYGYLRGVLAGLETLSEACGERIDPKTVTLFEMRYSLGRKKIFGGKRIDRIIYTTPCSIGISKYYYDGEDLPDSEEPDYSFSKCLPIISERQHKRLMQIEQACRENVVLAKQSRKSLKQVLEEKVGDFSDVISLLLKLRRVQVGTA